MDFHILMFGFTSLVPVIVSVLLYVLDKRTSFGKLDYALKQIIFGVSFGLVAIFATEFSVGIDGASMNVRDAAPLCAGFIFGGPAGIIAGVIGGLERWFAVYWGAGEYTRLACSLATVFAGVFAAALRKVLFNNRRSPAVLGAFFACATEVLHMMMIFFTNMDDVRTTFAIVKQCSIPMIVCNSFSVMLACFLVSRMASEGFKLKQRSIANVFQTYLLTCIAIVFAFTSVCVLKIETSLVDIDTKEYLSITMHDIDLDIGNVSDRNLILIADNIARNIIASGETDNEALIELSNKYDIPEINIVGSDGIIAASSYEELVGFNMASTEETIEFLQLSSVKGEIVQDYRPSAYGSAYRKYAGVSLFDGMFVQIGCDAGRFQKDIDRYVIGITRNRSINYGGYVLVANEEQMILGDKDNQRGHSLGELGVQIDISTMPKNVAFKCVVEGVDSYCMYDLIEGYYVVAVTSVKESMFIRDTSVYLTAFMEIIELAVLFIALYILIKKLIVDNIERINYSLSKITRGDLDVLVDVRDNKEFASLSDDINSTVSTLKRYIEKEAKRIDKELKFAKMVQYTMLPSVLTLRENREKFDIYALMDTAKEVGGDFYDFYLLADNSLVFLVADVSGKGISAAMFMMTAKTLLKSLIEQGIDISTACALANNELNSNNDIGMFVTCWMGILDLKTHNVTFVNAGHNYPLIKHKDGEFEYLSERSGFVLAGIGDAQYNQGTFDFRPGDEIFLYTDGITEAMNENGDMYGEKRLIDILNSNKRETAKEVCELIKDDVAKFVGGVSQFDDITMISLKILDENILTVKPTQESIREVVGFIDHILNKSDVPLKIKYKINIAVDEIYSNIVCYSGAQKAEVYCSVSGGRILVRFTDNGTPYNPLETTEPNISLSAEEREVGGLGIFVIRNIMDDVTYDFADGKNVLEMTKFMQEETDGQ